MTDVLDEHYGYLSLVGREEAFRKAIAQSVPQGGLVADLGCGFGVLGLWCLEAGAARVWGIDRSGAIEIARETVRREGCADVYECLADSTYRVALPEQVDVIICDHVGYFGFDYGIIDMVEDARRRFLKPGGTVMPRRLRLMAAGVSSPLARELAGAWDAPPIPPQYRWLREHAVNTKHSITVSAEDLCTAPVEIGMIDLAGDVPRQLSFAATLVAGRAGSFDGMVGWFECELADGVWMTNSPLSESRIDRPQAFLPCAAPFAVNAGDEVPMTLRFTRPDGVLVWSFTEPDSGKVQRQTTWKSAIIAPSELTPQQDGALSLNRKGAARKAVLDLIDGQRSAQDIEQAIVQAMPNLFPTPAEICRFVREELGRVTG